MDFPSVGFIRRRAVIFDLDTVSRLFHLLTPEPLHHPTGSRFILARRHMLSDRGRQRPHVGASATA